MCAQNLLQLATWLESFLQIQKWKSLEKTLVKTGGRSITRRGKELMEKAGSARNTLGQRPSLRCQQLEVLRQTQIIEMLLSFSNSLMFEAAQEQISIHLAY